MPWFGTWHRSAPPILLAEDREQSPYGFLINILALAICINSISN